VPTREQRWEELYERLVETPAELDKNDAFGEGDHWVVDDDWGACTTRFAPIPTSGAMAFGSESAAFSMRAFAWGVFGVFDDDPKGAAHHLFRPSRIRDGGLSVSPPHP
jgi:hypothetical protein